MWRGCVGNVEAQGKGLVAATRTGVAVKRKIERRREWARGEGEDGDIKIFGGA